MTTTSDPSAIYCMKCKAKTETTDVEQVTLNNGRPAATGICAVCGKKKFRDGGMEGLNWRQPVYPLRGGAANRQLRRMYRWRGRVEPEWVQNGIRSAWG